MKVIELFSLSKGKSLQDFDWGSSFIDVVNQHLPISNRITDPKVTGDFLYTQLLQLSSDEMMAVLHLTVDIRANVIHIVKHDNHDTAPVPRNDMEEDYANDRRRGKRQPDINSPPTSRVPTIAVWCAIALVVICLGLAFTQAILSVKSGRQVGDGRTVTSIASIIGDVVKAFVDSGSVDNRPRRRPRQDEYDYPVEDPSYDEPRRPTRRPSREDQLDDRYGTDEDPEASQEPMRPQSGNSDPPPY